MEAVTAALPCPRCPCPGPARRLRWRLGAVAPVKCRGQLNLRARRTLRSLLLLAVGAGGTKGQLSCPKGQLSCPMAQAGALPVPGFFPRLWL